MFTYLLVSVGVRLDPRGGERHDVTDSIVFKQQNGF